MDGPSNLYQGCLLPSTSPSSSVSTSLGHAAGRSAGHSIKFNSLWCAAALDEHQGESRLTVESSHGRQLRGRGAIVVPTAIIESQHHASFFVVDRSQDVSLSALSLMGGGNGKSGDPIVADGAGCGDAS